MTTCQNMALGLRAPAWGALFLAVITFFPESAMAYMLGSKMDVFVGEDGTVVFRPTLPPGRDRSEKFMLSNFRVVAYNACQERKVGQKWLVDDGVIMDRPWVSSVPVESIIYGHPIRGLYATKAIPLESGVKYSAFASGDTYFSDVRFRIQNSKQGKISIYVLEATSADGTSNSTLSKELCELQ